MDHRRFLDARALQRRRPGAVRGPGRRRRRGPHGRLRQRRGAARHAGAPARRTSGAAAAASSGTRAAPAATCSACSRARLDCDHDTVLLAVEPAGPACHTGAVSCFRDDANGGAAVELAAGGRVSDAARAGLRAPPRGRRRAAARRHPRPGAGPAPQGHRLGPAVQLRQRRREHGGAQGLRGRPRRT